MIRVETSSKTFVSRYWRGVPSTLAFTLFLITPLSKVAAQSTTGGTQLDTVASVCASRVSETEHSDALMRVCVYALSLSLRMPNFSCEQKTSRFIANQPVDVVTANVTYEGNNEAYRDIKTNGAPVRDADLLNAASWSTGQFGGDIQSIFRTGNKISFQFVNERQIDGRSVLTFQYKVPRQDVPVWRLHFKDQVLSPPFHGQLRIDAASGALLRFLVIASELPRSYPMRSADVDIKYGQVSFGDGTSFLLPVASVMSGLDRKGTQTRNELEFLNCHKYRATARMTPE
jgi:hypothetical protein